MTKSQCIICLTEVESKYKRLYCFECADVGGASLNCHHKKAKRGWLKACKNFNEYEALCELASDRMMNERNPWS